MIVLEGKRNKSNQVVDIIKKEIWPGTKTVVFNHLEGRAVKEFITPRDAHVMNCEPNETPESVVEAFEEACGHNVFKEYDWIVFNLEAPIDMLDRFKELDRKYPNNFVVTFRSDDSLTHKYLI